MVANMKQVTKNELAAKFSQILREWLTTEELAEVNARNQADEYKSGGVCATHDFCDPNQAMLDAMESFGIFYEGCDQTTEYLINNAWRIAKASRFSL